MEEGKENKKSSMREKKRAKSLFKWTEEEELNLLKKLVEFSANNMVHEEFYPFLRNGSLAEVSKIQIFDKIQQLKKKYSEKLEYSTMRMQLQLQLHVEDERDEAFELSKQLWGEAETETKTETETESASTSKALDESNMRYFEQYFSNHGLELDLFVPSFLESTKKEVDELFCLQSHHLLIKTNLKAHIAQLKHHIIQTRFQNHTN